MYGSRVLSFVMRLLVHAMLTMGAANAADDRRYSHIFIIVEENHGYDQLIGNPNAPNINRLADTFGIATNFYGEVHPSEANYIAMIGGSTFGIHDDDAFYCSAGKDDPNCVKATHGNYADHTITSRSLVDQLRDHGLTWRGYFESIPAPGSMATFSAASDSPVPAQPDRLYAAKHNGFINFFSVQNEPDLAERFVGFDRLSKDLANGTLPNYAHVIPNQCNEMHGLDERAPGVPADCGYGNDQGLIARGDAKIGAIIGEIQASPAWSAQDNFAIVITWDEDDGPHPHRDAGKVQGCCGSDPGSAANFGGGHIATIVITNHGPRGVKDNTPFNHYSLLRTTQDAFGITEHLQGADDEAKGVLPMSKLFWK